MCTLFSRSLISGFMGRQQKRKASVARASSQNCGDSNLNTPKKSKEDIVNEAQDTPGDGGVSPKTRNRSAEVAVDQAVSRAIKDHFSCYSAAELVDITVEGENLFSYVKKHFVSARAKHQNLTSSWWAAVHDKLDGVKADWVDLEPSMDSGDPESLFCSALEECHSKNPAMRRCTKMDHYLRSCERDLHPVELCALFNSVARSFRRQSKFALDYALAVARYVVRRNMTTNFGGEIKRMHRFFDKAVTALYTRLKKSDITHSGFIASHRALVNLVVACVDLEVVIAGESRAQWTELRDPVCRVVSSSMLGRALYAETWSKIQGAEFSHKVQLILKRVESMSRQELDGGLDGVRRELAHLGQQAAQDNSFKAMATIEVEFLGARLRLPSGDPSKEVNFRLHAVLKNLSVGFSDGVSALPYEAWLFSERASSPAIVTKEHLIENEVARLQFTTLARRSANTMLCQFISMVEDRKAKPFLDLDPFFLLEVLYLRHQAEAACNAFVRTTLFSLLPGPDHQCTVSQALRDLAALRTSPLVRDAELGETTQWLDAVEQQLHLLLNCEGPSLGVDPSPAKRELFERYSYFFSMPAELAEDALGTPARGKLAFRACCALIGEKYKLKPDCLTLDDLKPLSGFGFLMDPEVETDYRKWMAVAAKNFQAQPSMEANPDPPVEEYELEQHLDRLAQEERAEEAAADVAFAAASFDAASASSHLAEPAEPEKPTSSAAKSAAATDNAAPLGPLKGRGRGRGRGSEMPKAATKAKSEKTKPGQPSGTIADLFGKKYVKT